MLSGAAAPFTVEYLYRRKHVKSLAFPSGQPLTFNACMEVARAAIRDCWVNESGLMRLKNEGSGRIYDLVRVLSASDQEICRWSIEDERRHGRM